MGFAKPFIAILLTLSIGASTFVVPLTYLDFEMRRDYIAKVLCEKKTEPMTVCGGKCYLTNQLDKFNQPESTLPVTSLRLLQDYFTYEGNSLVPQPPYYYSRGAFTDYNEMDRPIGYINACFRPPQSVMNTSISIHFL